MCELNSIAEYDEWNLQNCLNQNLQDLRIYQMVFILLILKFGKF